MEPPTADRLGARVGSKERCDEARGPRQREEIRAVDGLATIAVCEHDHQRREGESQHRQNLAPLPHPPPGAEERKPPHAEGKRLCRVGSQLSTRQTRRQFLGRTQEVAERVRECREDVMCVVDHCKSRHQIGKTKRPHREHHPARSDPSYNRQPRHLDRDDIWRKLVREDNHEIDAKQGCHGPDTRYVDRRGCVIGDAFPFPRLRITFAQTDEAVPPRMPDGRATT